MDLATSLLLFTLPLFAILVPLIQGLGRWIHVRMLVGWWAIVGLLIPLFGVMMLIVGGVPQPKLILGVLSFDGYSAYFAIVFLSITLLISVASLYYMRQNPNLDTYFGLLLFATFGMILIAFSVDLVTLFLSWELMNIPSYILTGIQKDDQRSNEAAIKFFIL